MKIIITIIVLIIIIIYSLQAKKTLIYQVKSRDTISSIANELKILGAINSKSAFILLAKIKQIMPKIGYYDFKNIYDFLDNIHDAKVKTGMIVLVPGKTTNQYYKKIKNTQFIKTKLSFKKIMLSLKIPKPYEGRFLPQTYQFNYGDSAKSIFKQSYKLMNNSLKKIWQKRDKNKFIKNQYQLLILASILEKESGNSYESAKIAGVFINRLKKNMRLQSDATTIYGLGKKYIGTITKKNLHTKNKYNTYQIKGLPFGAITNPSLDSIIAASNPQKHEFLYFVAKNIQEHIFAKTYTQHRKNIKKYIPIKN